MAGRCLRADTTTVTGRAERSRRGGWAAVWTDHAITTSRCLVRPCPSRRDQGVRLMSVTRRRYSGHRAFILRGGDCAESFKEFKANNICNTFRVLLQMGDVLMFGGQVLIVKMGRMACQFAKPRSDNFEEKDGVMLPSYRRDNVKGDAFDLKGRAYPR